MVHTLKTVGDLLELCKRLPEDMGLREFYVGSRYLPEDQNNIHVETEMADHIKVRVIDVDEDNVVLEILSSSLESEIFNTKELNWNEQ